jgi:hypothetical protein
MALPIWVPNSLGANKDVLIEIRGSTNLDASHATFFFSSEHMSEAGPLKSGFNRVESGTNVFQKTTELPPNYRKHRFAAIIVPEGGRRGLAQVFLFHWPTKVGTSWSEWRPPDYTESARTADMAFMRQLSSPDRSTNGLSLSNCFEMRFQINK